MAYQTTSEAGKLRCEVCPHACRLADGQRGLCFVRRREGEHIVCTTYGRSRGFGIDPIEKKPLYHFLPGSLAFSFGTAGCNLSCRFCQNWHLSHSQAVDEAAEEAAPEAIAETARRQGCQSVAFTYNDPVVFLEYAIDTAAACHARDVATVAVTAGYIHGRARADFFSAMDAVNVDLKAFNDEFYRKQCKVRLQPVLDTLRHIARETDCWLEITTLLIPGLNDDPTELQEMAAWVYDELGPDVPWHLSAFHPAGEVTDIERTPLATLHKARRIAREAGMRYIYTGNVADPEGGVTDCASCGHRLIERDRFAVDTVHLDAAGNCPACGTALPGVWGRGEG